MTTEAAGLGLAEVLAAHRFMPDRGIGSHRCSCGYPVAPDAHRAHVAEEVRTWLRAALTSPEVIEAARQAINAADNEALERTNFEHLCATYDEQATAALAAAAETLGAK